MKATLIVLAGPTAVGKSEIALVVAERLGGEIISADSMQVYRGLDIGTAKPSAQDRARVPHHLIDVVAPNENFDAAEFVRLARAAEADIRARGKVPILCGGSGFYVKAFLEGISAGPKPDAKLRAELEATSLPELLRELLDRDPEAHARIDQRNKRRVMRAIEVIRQTGRPFSEALAKAKTAEDSAGDRLLVGLSRSPVELRARINRRVDEMFRRGLVAETQALLAGGLDTNQTAMQALGYRQVAEHLRGERSLQATVELVKIKTGQFARKQMTWFRRQLQLRWMELSEASEPQMVAEKVLGEFGQESA